MTRDEIIAYGQIVEDSILTPAGVERAYDFAGGQLRKWLSGEVKPSKKSSKRLEDCMRSLEGKKRIPWHPSGAMPPPSRLSG